MPYRPRKVAAEVARKIVADRVSAVVLAGAREAVRLVPRDTGTLANSIGSTVTVDGTRVRGVISAGTDYAAPVEFGTHSAGESGAPGKVSHGPGGMPARPYMRPGLQAGLVYARRKGLIK